MALSKVSKSSNTAGKDRADRLRNEFGDSPWYGQGGQQMPWSGPEGQQRGQRAPMYTPSAGDSRNDGYRRGDLSPEAQAAWQGQQDVQNTAQRAAFGADPAMSAARGAGDMRGYIAARQALGQRGQEQRFIDQGGTAETWARRNDENAGWPVPGSPSGNYQYGPGRPGPTPPGVAGGGGGGGGGRGGLIEGYVPDAPSRTMASTGQSSAQPQGGMQAHNMIGTPEDMARSQAMSAMRQQQGIYGRDNIANWMQQQQGGYGQMSGGGGGQYGPMSQAMGQMQGQMGGNDPRNQIGNSDAYRRMDYGPQQGNMDGWAYPGPSQAMQTQERGFPGGMQPVNPGPFGGRPVDPGYPTAPYPGSFPGSRLPGPPGSGYAPGQQMQPFQTGQYGGPLPNNMMGGMQMFGYQPYQPQMSNQFAGMFQPSYY